MNQHGDRLRSGGQVSHDALGQDPAHASDVIVDRFVDHSVNSAQRIVYVKHMADRVGFEPTLGF